MGCLGSYKVTEVYDNGTMCVTIINNSSISFLTNEHQLFLYHKPLTWESLGN